MKYIQSPDQAVETLQAIKAFSPRAVAVDFETTKSNIRLVQLGIDEKGYRPRQIVFDCHCFSSTMFADLFQDKSVAKIIHFSSFEQGWAARELGVVFENVIDTCIGWRTIQSGLKPMYSSEAQQYIPGYSPHKNSLQAVCEQYLGFSLPKDEQASNWGRKKLSKDQIQYAALDVAVLHPLARYMFKVAQKLGVQKKIDQSINKVRHTAKQKIK